MQNQVIKKIEVNLVTEPVTAHITDATRTVGSIGYLIVRLTTDQGLEGFGVTYNEVGGIATKTLIEDSLAPMLIGRNPFETEQYWQDMFQYLRGVGRKGLMFCALSVVDIALWDLKGKITGMPVYQLMGGAETKLPVYASGGWSSYTDDELVEEMKGLVDLGYSMIKFKVGVEGGMNPMRDVARVRKVRDAVGPDIKIMLDANNCWDSATGARFANCVKECDILFLEEPVIADDIPGLQEFKMRSDLPLATGEHEYTRYGARDLLINRAVDIVQLDGTRAGGFTEMLKVIALAQAFNKKVAPHAMENVHIHLLSAAGQNGFSLERLKLFENVTAKVFKDAPLPEIGFMTIPTDKPGLGLTLDMDYIKANEKEFLK